MPVLSACTATLRGHGAIHIVSQIQRQIILRVYLAGLWM